MKMRGGEGGNFYKAYIQHHHHKHPANIHLYVLFPAIVIAPRRGRLCQELAFARSRRGCRSPTTFSLGSSVAMSSPYLLYEALLLGCPGLNLGSRRRSESVFRFGSLFENEFQKWVDSRGPKVPPSMRNWNCVCERGHAIAPRNFTNGVCVGGGAAFERALFQGTFPTNGPPDIVRPRSSVPFFNGMSLLAYAPPRTHRPPIVRLRVDGTGAHGAPVPGYIPANVYITVYLYMTVQGGCYSHPFFAINILEPLGEKSKRDEEARPARPGRNQDGRRD